MTKPLNRLSLNALLHDAVTKIKREVRPLPIAFHNPLGMGIPTRGKVTQSVFLEFINRLALRSSTYRSVPKVLLNVQPSLSKGVTQVFSLDEVRQLLSSRDKLTALEPAHGHFLGVPRQHSVTAIASLAPVFPRADPAQTESSDERTTPKVAAFTNRVVTTPGQSGMPFQQAQARAPITGTTPATGGQGPTRLALTAGVRPQPLGLPTKPAGALDLPTEFIHPPRIMAPRTNIVHYIRKTNICFQFAFRSRCPRHSTGRCPFVHGIILEGAFATANPPSVHKSYGTPYVRPLRRLFALTDEPEDLLTSWGIATPGIDQPEN